MKKYRSLTEILMLVGFFVLIGGIGNLQGAPSDPASNGSARLEEAGAGYLENITFDKSKGKERVTLLLSRPGVPATQDLGGRRLLIKLELLHLTAQQRRTWGEGTLDNLIRLVSEQKTTKTGPQALFTMELARPVPYSIRQAGPQVVIEFNVASLTAEPAGGRTTSATSPPAASAGLPKSRAPIPPAPVPDVAPPYKNKLISLELQDANLKSVLQLMAEEGGVNIVSGDDVKGKNVTIQLKKIPWEQALTTIMGITGTVKKQDGKIITVMTTEQMRKEEKSLKDAEKDRRDTEIERKKEEQEKQVQEGKLRQISIEAKIVEATDEFARQLGVQWGAGFTENLKVNKQSYPYALVAGANPIGSNFGTMTGVAQGLAMTTTNLAANFPMASGVPSFALGMVISSAYGLLDAQIAASEKTSDVRIISTPKVTTMDGEKAIIKQGEDVPIITPATAQSAQSVSFKEAVLMLEVKPKITPQGKISMEVTAKNDAADYARAAQLQGNPPISKSEVNSKVVVGDGDTLVIGGILKQSTSKGESGLPWISKVPILGWLFKYENTNKQRKQLLIFVTPRIMKDEAPKG